MKPEEAFAMFAFAPFGMFRLKLLLPVVAALVLAPFAPGLPG